MVSVRPVTFWLARRVIVKTEYISPPIMDITNAAASVTNIATAGTGLAVRAVFIQKRSYKPRNAAHVHYARHAKVKIAALFG